MPLTQYQSHTTHREWVIHSFAPLARFATSVPHAVQSFRFCCHEFVLFADGRLCIVCTVHCCMRLGCKMCDAELPANLCPSGGRKCTRTTEHACTSQIFPSNTVTFPGSDCDNNDGTSDIAEPRNTVLWLEPRAGARVDTWYKRDSGIG